MSKADTNQASEDKPINQHLVCLWQLQDIEETIADASPEELVDQHSKLVALSTDITEAVQSAIRNEKLKLLAEVRERVVGEKKDQEYRLIDTEYASTRKEKVYLSDGISRNKLRNEQIAELTKLEAEL